MRRNFPFTIHLLSTLTLFSCINEFDLKDRDATSEQYVVNGLLYKDSLAQIYLNRSSFFDDRNEISWIADAEVRLSWYSGTGLETGEELLVFQDSFYISQSRMEAGRQYSLQVRLGDGTMLQATTHIPEPVLISSTRFIHPAGYMQTSIVSGNFSRMFMDFETAGGKPYYFETKIYQAYEYHPGEDTIYNILNTFNNDEVILKEALPTNQLYAFVFSLDGEADNSLRLAFDFFAFLIFDSEFHPVLQTVSREYYLYKKSLIAHLDALQMQDEFSTNDLYMPGIFKAVTPVYSNIQGGKGIFAGLSRDERKTVCNLVGYSCE